MNANQKLILSVLAAVAVMAVVVGSISYAAVLADQHGSSDAQSDISGTWYQVSYTGYDSDDQLLSRSYGDPANNDYTFAIDQCRDGACFGNYHGFTIVGTYVDGCFACVYDDGATTCG